MNAPVTERAAALPTRGELINEIAAEWADRVTRIVTAADQAAWHPASALLDLDPHDLDPHDLDPHGLEPGKEDDPAAEARRRFHVLRVDRHDRYYRVELSAPTQHLARWVTKDEVRARLAEDAGLDPAAIATEAFSGTAILKIIDPAAVADLRDAPDAPPAPLPPLVSQTAAGLAAIAAHRQHLDATERSLAAVKTHLDRLEFQAVLGCAAVIAAAFAGALGATWLGFALLGAAAIASLIKLRQQRLLPPVRRRSAWTPRRTRPLR